MVDFDMNMMSQIRFSLFVFQDVVSALIDRYSGFHRVSTLKGQLASKSCNFGKIGILGTHR